MSAAATVRRLWASGLHDQAFDFVTGLHDRRAEDYEAWTSANRALVACHTPAPPPDRAQRRRLATWSRRGGPTDGRGRIVLTAASVARVATCSRPSGRPAGRPARRASSASGDDPGEPPPGPPGPSGPSGPPLLFLVDPVHGKLNHALARHLRRVGA